MISHQILSRALLDYHKTIIRGGRGDKMKEVTRQIAEAVPTKYHTSYVKMQGHDKQKKGSFWGGYGSSELGEVPVLSCKKPRYGKGNHFIKGPIDLRWIQIASQKGAAELALFIFYTREIRMKRDWDRHLNSLQNFGWDFNARDASMLISKTTQKIEFILQK